MNEINLIKEDIKKLQQMIATGKKMMLQFPTDTLLAHTITQYKQRLKMARQKLKKAEVEQVVAA